MKYRNMGRTGLRVSEICLGTMTFGFQTERPDAFAIMDIAFERGVNFIDTADVYPLGTSDVGATEAIVGEWMRGKPRDQIILATKCVGPTSRDPNHRGASRQHILDAVDASLKRLGTDHIDLYQLHSPTPRTPIDETLKALDDLQRWGKIRYAGASNYRAWQLALALGESRRGSLIRFDCDQPRYNILWRDIEADLLPLCQDQGVGIIAYNPLAGGFLTGKYQNTEDLQDGTRFKLGNAAQRYQARYWHEAQFDQVRILADHFSAKGQSLTHAAIQWVLAQPGITSAIVGASRPAQIQDSLDYDQVQLTEADLQVCDQAWYNIPRPSDPEVALR